MRSPYILLLVVAVAGCGSITALQLEPGTLDLKKGTPEGIVYYLPKPYLLVALGPVQGGQPGKDLSVRQLSRLKPEEQATLMSILK